MGDGVCALMRGLLRRLDAGLDLIGGDCVFGTFFLGESTRSLISRLK